MLECPLQHAGCVKLVTVVVALLQLLSRVKPAEHSCSRRVSQGSSCRFVVSHQKTRGLLLILYPTNHLMMMSSLEHPSLEEKLQELGLVSLEKTERESHQPIQISQRCVNRMLPDFLGHPVAGHNIRSNSHKLKDKEFHLNMRENFFP